MALIASLTFGEPKKDGVFYKICDFTYHASRSHNQFRPDGDARCEHIELTIHVPDKKDPTLHEWFVKGTTLDGCILLDTSESANPQSKEYNKRFEFKDAVCCEMTENYDIAVTEPRTLTLRIVAAKVTVSNYKFTANNKQTTSATFSGRLLLSDPTSLTGPVKPKDCYVVQAFSYDCKRERNADGRPFGPTPGAMLDFEVKMEDADKGKCFYEGMDSNQAQDLNFIFDSDDNLKQSKFLYDFAHGILARGYIVEIEETYDKTVKEGSSMLLQMHVKMLLSKLAFMKSGKIQNGKVSYECTTLTITND